MFRKLGIEPGEGRVFAWGAAALFLLGWADVSMKNVSETFFMKRVGVENLPLVFLVNSLLLVLTTWAFGRVVERSDRLRLLPRVFLGLGILLMPLWLLVKVDVQSVFVLLMIASKQVTSIALMIFWIAMGDLLHSRQSKRLFAPMMAGVTLGTMLGSFASEPIGRLLGIDGLLPASALVLVLAAAVTIPLRRLRPQFEAARPQAAPVREQLRRVEAGEEFSVRRLWRESWLFRLLFLTALCSGLLGPMLYFQFSYVADLATAGAQGEEKLLAFYAQFRGWISVGILVTQLLVSASLYRRIGIPLASALSPLVYLFGFLGLSVRLSLPAGVGAMAGTKLQDNAVYDPALRMLFNLFPEEFRARASAWVEGPVKRAGGAVGNVVIIAALGVGSAQSVGYTAVPIAALWLVVALVLWRLYPRLLLQASVRRGAFADGIADSELLDPATVRALAPELVSEDPERARAALDLIKDAKPELAVGALAGAARQAPDATRPLLIAALDDVLETSIADPVTNSEAAEDLRVIWEEARTLDELDRVTLAQAYGRLADADDGVELLESALRDGAPAVQLAAHAALYRRDLLPEGERSVDAALAAAVEDGDAVARRTAREECRAFLLCGDPDAAGMWEGHANLLASMLKDADERIDVAEALAEIAAFHGERMSIVSGPMLDLREDPAPRLLAPVLRYVGHVGLHDEVHWLLEHLGSRDAICAAAAEDGLRALGPLCTDTLLRELAFGKRSKRDGILAVVREFDVSPETLRGLYERELDSTRNDLVHLVVIGDRPALAILHQRIEERVQEKLHTALLFQAVIRGEDRIAELGDLLREGMVGARRRAILLEALESLLGPSEKAELLPLIEERDLRRRGRDAADRLGMVLPSLDETLRTLSEDPEELTRVVAAAAGMASGASVVDHGAGMDPVEKMLHLKTLPIFEGLTTRQLMDLAAVVVEEAHPPDVVVMREGDYDDFLYLVIEGVLKVTKGGTDLAETGPGSFLGEVALFEGVARSATATTQTRVRLLRLERADLLQLIEEMPGIAVCIVQTLSRRLRELTDRLIV